MHFCLTLADQPNASVTFHQFLSALSHEEIRSNNPNFSLNRLEKLQRLKKKLYLTDPTSAMYAMKENYEYCTYSNSAFYHRQKRFFVFHSAIE
jgi:hypothetical protein